MQSLAVSSLVYFHCLLRRVIVVVGDQGARISDWAYCTHVMMSSHRGMSNTAKAWQFLYTVPARAFGGASVITQ